MRCAECGCELRETSGPVTEKYRGESITVNGIRRLQCDNCGEYELSADEADRMSRMLADEYARRHGLLSPSEIRALRKGLRMTQRQFEEAVGVSSPTCSRWENGTSQQSRTADRLMRLMRDVPGVADRLVAPATSVITSEYRGEIIQFRPAKSDRDEQDTPEFEEKEG